MAFRPYPTPSDTPTVAIRAMFRSAADVTITQVAYGWSDGATVRAAYVDALSRIRPIVAGPWPLIGCDHPTAL